MGVRGRRNWASASLPLSTCSYLIKEPKVKLVRGVMPPHSASRLPYMYQGLLNVSKLSWQGKYNSKKIFSLWLCTAWTEWITTLSFLPYICSPTQRPCLKLFLPSYLLTLQILVCSQNYIYPPRQFPQHKVFSVAKIYQALSLSFSSTTLLVS